MTGVRMSLDLGHEPMAAALAELQARGEDPSPAMDEIGAAMVTVTLLRFERGEDPDGNAWLPSLRVQHQGGQTLVDRAILRDSITHVFDAQSVAWGTNVIYAAIHQFGGTIKAKDDGFLTFVVPGVGFRRKKQVTIPARPYLGINADDQGEITDILRDHIAGAVQ